MGLQDVYGDALNTVDEDPIRDDHPHLPADIDPGDDIGPGTKAAIRDVLRRRDEPVSGYTIGEAAGYADAYPIGAAFRLGDDLKEMQAAGEVVKVDSRHYVSFPADADGGPDRSQPLAADTTPGTPAAIHDVLDWMGARLDEPVLDDAIAAAAGYDDTARAGHHLAEMEEAGDIERDGHRYTLLDR